MPSNAQFQEETVRSGVITLTGRPNVGKSTLLNQVLGSELSVVSAKPQTTRDQIRGILTEKQGQIVFIDTPGIHRAKKGGINEIMVNEAKLALSEPSLVWYLVDPQSSIEHEMPVLQFLASVNAPIFLILNKSDLIHGKAALLGNRSQKLLDEIQAYAETKDIKIAKVFLVSAKKRKGLDPLLELTWNSLPEGEPFFSDPDYISDKPTRFFVAEMIREQLYKCLGDEIPYSCAVKIDLYEEGAKLDRIEGTIFVERESQKPMVIGKQGKKIKEISQNAREKIEVLVDKKVFLRLQVKVLPDWTKNADALKQLGYQIEGH